MTGPSERPETVLWSARRDGPVLRVSGALDALTARDVAGRLAAEVADGVSQLDLSGVELCAAAGVRALLAGQEAAQARQVILSVICPPGISRVLELCGVTELDGWQVVSTGGNGTRDDA